MRSMARVSTGFGLPVLGRNGEGHAEEVLGIGDIMRGVNETAGPPNI